RCAIGPLEVVKKDDERVAGASQRAKQTAEHPIEADLRFRRAERHGFRRFLDETFETRNDIEDDLCAWPYGLRQRSTPHLYAPCRLAKELSHKLLECLPDCAIRRAAVELIELSGDEISPASRDGAHHLTDQR